MAALYAMQRPNWTTLNWDIDDKDKVVRQPSDTVLQSALGSGQGDTSSPSPLPGSEQSSTHGFRSAGSAEPASASTLPSLPIESLPLDLLLPIDAQAPHPASYPGNLPPLHKPGQRGRGRRLQSSHSFPTTPERRGRFSAAGDFAVPTSSSTEPSATQSFASPRPTQPSRAIDLEKNRQAQARFRDKQKRRERDMQTRIGELERQLQEMHMETNSAKRENQVLNKVLELRETHIKVLKEITEPPGSSATPSNPTAARSQAPSPPTLEQLRTLNARDAARLWCDYVQTIAMLLLSVETLQPDPQAVQRLEALTHDACRMLQTLGVVNPAVWAAMMRMNLESLQPFAADAFRAEAFQRPVWADKAQALGLCPEQREQVRVIGRQHLDTLARLDAEALPVKRELEALLPHCAIDVEEASTSSSSKAHDLVQCWKTIYHQKQASWFTLTSTILFKVLTPTQMARFCVDAYPHAPVPNAILAAVMSPSGNASDASESAASPPPAAALQRGSS